MYVCVCVCVVCAHVYVCVVCVCNGVYVCACIVMHSLMFQIHDLYDDFHIVECPLLKEEVRGLRR